MHDPLEFSHASEQGRIRMVDIAGKAESERTARAEAVVRVGPAIAERLRTAGAVDKGPALETARIAGIMAAKRACELIPLCHPIPLSIVDIAANLTHDAVRLESFVRSRSATGVEMEAMTAAAVAALTIYDMCKSAGKGIVIETVRLLEKTGGRSGVWRARTEEDLHP